MSWILVPVRGTYRTFTGAPASGWVRFTLPYRMVDQLSGVVIPADGELQVDLDQYGHFEVMLPATDDPSITPTGWVYRVQERFFDQDGRNFPMAVPKAAAQSGIDLKDVLPADVFPPESTVLYKGVPGGVAVLDAFGRVLDGFGHPVLGGNAPAALVVPFSTPESTWARTHDLGRLPVVNLYLSDGTPVDAPTIVSTTTVLVTWPYPVAGTMILS